MRNLITAAAAICFVASPIAAQAGTRANEIVPAAVTTERDVQPVAGASAIGEGESAVAYAILAGIIVIAVVFAIEILGDDDDFVSDG